MPAVRLSQEDGDTVDIITIIGVVAVAVIIECYGDYHIGTVIVTITVLEDVVAEDAHVLMWTSTGIST